MLFSSLEGLVAVAVVQGTEKKNQWTTSSSFFSSFDRLHFRDERSVLTPVLVFFRKKRCVLSLMTTEFVLSLFALYAAGVYDRDGKTVE